MPVVELEIPAGQNMNSFARLKASFIAFGFFLIHQIADGQNYDDLLGSQVFFRLCVNLLG